MKFSLFPSWFNCKQEYWDTLMMSQGWANMFVQFVVKVKCLLFFVVLGTNLLSLVPAFPPYFLWIRWGLAVVGSDIRRKRHLCTHLCHRLTCKITLSVKSAFPWDRWCSPGIDLVQVQIPWYSLLTWKVLTKSERDSTAQLLGISW